MSQMLSVCYGCESVDLSPEARPRILERGLRDRVLERVGVGPTQGVVSGHCR